MAELKTTETPVVEQAEYMAPRAASQAKWLTFEYALAMVSVTFAAITSVVLVPMLFGMWSAKEAMSFGLMLSGSITANILAVSILAVLFSVLAFVLFGRVTRAIAADRSGYTGRLAYKLTTYGSLFMIVLAALPLVANLISVLISSLLLIGVSDAGSVYTALYLGNFLPSLVCLAVLAVVVFFIGKIINGYNKSRPLAITLIAITSVVAVALAITLAVQAHDKPSIKKSNFKYNSSYLLD
ncbi:hypothetical protein V4210_02735 [Candidatus Nanosynbacter sp. BB002]|uniref:hypothetical protein n=1 Tax=Candidatus Nanosynbacter sp. BB002 TaxID=3393757 RepID=UPI0030CAB087